MEHNHLLVEHECDICGTKTTLMYKTGDGHGNMIDRHVCAKCLLDDIWFSFRNYLNSKRENPLPLNHKECASERFDDKMLELNDAININLEYAEVKVQHIDAYNLVHAGVPMAVMVRSLINNNYHCYPSEIASIGQFNDWLAKTFAKEFPNSYYHPDIVSF